MHAQIVEYVKLLLQSPAFKAELDKYLLDFTAGSIVTITDCNGIQIPLVLNHALDIQPFAEVIASDPPRNVPAPYPKCYVYHIQSEYPPREQEADIKVGYHRLGLSIFGSGKVPEEAEIVTEVLGSVSVNLIERNQYMYAAIPRALGGSSLAYAESEVSGQKLAQNVSPFHIVLVVKMREQRSN